MIGNEPNLGRFWFPTFNAERYDRVGGDLRGGARGELRRAEGGQPEHRRDRPRGRRRAATTARARRGTRSRRCASSRPSATHTARAAARSRSWTTSRCIRTRSSTRIRRTRAAPWPNVGRRRTSTARSRRSGTRFNGTAQPTFEEAGVQRAQSGAPVQVDARRGGLADGHARACAGYFGSENTADRRRGDAGAVLQAVVQRYACDPHVAALLFFHWIDEADRDRLPERRYRAPTDDEARGERGEGRDRDRLPGAAVAVAALDEGRRRDARRGSRRPATSSRSRRTRTRRSTATRRRRSRRSSGEAHRSSASTVKGRSRRTLSTGHQVQRHQAARTRARTTTAVKITAVAQPARRRDAEEGTEADRRRRTAATTDGLKRVAVISDTHLPRASRRLPARCVELCRAPT